VSEIRIVVPAPSPSLNAFSFSHWRVQHTAKKRWARLILACLPAPKTTLQAQGKRRLTIERHGKRSLDQDNLTGGAKCVITDNLRALGLLVDDNPTMLELSAVNVKLARGEAPHTVLILQDC
jgi:hypothetical protein